MAVQEGKLHDELLPELEFHVTPSKLSDTVRVDIGNFDDSFMKYLVLLRHIKDEIHNDCQIMHVSKFPKFCQVVRDAFRTYKLCQHINSSVKNVT